MYPVNDYLIIEAIPTEPPKETGIIYNPQDHEVRYYRILVTPAFTKAYKRGVKIAVPASAIVELPDGKLAVKMQEVIAHA